MVSLGNPAEKAILSKQKDLREGTGGYDEEIIEKFADDFKTLADGDNENWFNDSDGVLAIIIMYQFFAKYMFRGDKRAFLFEIDAIQLSRYIVEESDYNKIYTDY